MIFLSNFARIILAQPHITSQNLLLLHSQLTTFHKPNEYWYNLPTRTMIATSFSTHPSFVAWFDWISASIDSNAHQMKEPFYDRFIARWNIFPWYKSSDNLFCLQSEIIIHRGGKASAIVGSDRRGYRTALSSCPGWRRQFH